jgi:hypothetical protein
MTKKELQAAADKMIGAAQKLEATARELKAQAKQLRAGDLHSSVTSDLWMMHKTADVKQAAGRALVELGTLPENGWLIERRPIEEGGGY